MKIWIIAALYAVSLLGFAAPVPAADAGLTLGEAVETALANNGALLAARQEMGLRDASAISAGLWPNPVIEAGGAYAGASEYVVSAGISQEIPTGGKISKRVHAAGKEIAVYSHVLRDRERLLAEEVKEAFWDALSGEELLRLTERTIELNRDLVRLAEERLKEGDIPELELLLSNVELGRAEERRLAAQAALAEARTRLFSLMGAVDPGRRLVEPPVIITAGPTSDLEEAALANRPDIKALKAAVEKADADLAAADAGRWPDVTASLFYERESSSIEFGNADVNDTDNFIGLKLSVPIPLFDRNQGGMAEAQANRGAAATRLDFLEDGVRKEVGLALTRAELAKAATEIYEKRIIPQAEENLLLMQEAYRLGEVGILNIVEEQRKFVELSEKYISTRKDAAMAAAALETAVGADMDGGGI